MLGSSSSNAKEKDWPNLRNTLVPSRFDCSYVARHFFQYQLIIFLNTELLPPPQIALYVEQGTLGDMLSLSVSCHDVLRILKNMRLSNTSLVQQRDNQDIGFLVSKNHYRMQIVQWKV